jgi:hypothetical protein
VPSEVTMGVPEASAIHAIGCPVMGQILSG